MEQGDEEILEKLAFWIADNFRVTVKMKIPFRELFPKPEQKYLWNIWKNGHGDLLLFKHGRLSLIVEPGGRAHFTNERQKTRDKYKDILSKINEVGVLRLSNNIINYLEKPITRKLFKKYLYGLV